MNRHATDCRQLADRIEAGFLSGAVDTDEAIGELRQLALRYAAKCDGLEAMCGALACLPLQAA